MAQGLDATKTADRPSHEAIEESGVDDTEVSKINRVAMESAKRAQNRIHADEGNIPGSQEFTK
jgi:hypothetical protein